VWPRKRRAKGPPTGAIANAVIDRLLAKISQLEMCEHDQDGFAMWIATRPGHLLCSFCYQAAQVLADDICCAACSAPAGVAGRDAIVVTKISEEMGAHFYLCQACMEADLGFR